MKSSIEKRLGKLEEATRPKKRLITTVVELMHFDIFYPDESIEDAELTPGLQELVDEANELREEKRRA